jgi:glutamate/tyrosine decarboxylase-like PLP-dependent enzyme
VTPQDVLTELTALQARDVPTHGGATMAYVYDSGRTDIEELAAAAQAAFQWTNALDPTAFPSVARIENDLVAAALALLGGAPGAVGTLTSGGTESCLLAVLAARETWRANGGAGRARLLLPVTAHAAFRKAAHLFDLEVVDVPVDPVTCRADVGAVADLLDERTALVVVTRSARWRPWPRQPGRRATWTPASAAGSCRSWTTSPSRSTCRCPA